MTWLVGIGIAITLFIVFPKQMFAILGILIVAGLVAWAAINHFNEVAAAKRASVTVVASIDWKVCKDFAFPILVAIHNGSAARVDKVSFDLYAYRPGHSEPVLRGYSYVSDVIIQPGQGYWTCWSVAGTLPSDLSVSTVEWRIGYSNVTFEGE